MQRITVVKYKLVLLFIFGDISILTLVGLQGFIITSMEACHNGTLDKEALTALIYSDSRQLTQWLR